MMEDTNKPFISPPIKVYDRTIAERNAEIEAIELSENETKYCLWRGKLDKWYKSRNAEYWAEKEAKKPGKASW